MQLTCEAGNIQVKDAKLGCIFNVCRAAVTNYVLILDRII